MVSFERILNIESQPSFWHLRI